MNRKLERAIEALEEAADALDDLPPLFRRRIPLLDCHAISTGALRSEAAWLTAQGQQLDELSYDDVARGRKG